MDVSPVELISATKIEDGPLTALHFLINKLSCGVCHHISTGL